MLHEFYLAVLAAYRASSALLPAQRHRETAEPSQPQEGPLGILLPAASGRGVQEARRDKYSCCSGGVSLATSAGGEHLCALSDGLSATGQPRVPSFPSGRDF